MHAHMQLQRLNLPERRLKMPHSKFLQLSEDCKAFTEKSMEFQRKIIERSGLGDETYLPEGRYVQTLLFPALPSICSSLRHHLSSDHRACYPHGSRFGTCGRSFSMHA